MIHELSSDLIRWFRESRQLTQKQVSKTINRNIKLVGRWEKGQIPTPEQEKEFFEATGASTAQVTEFICQWLSDFTGQKVAVVPEEQVTYLPVLPLASAVKHYNENYGRLTPKQRKAIEGKLRQARVFDAASEQMLSMTAQGIEQEIDLALAKNSDASNKKTSQTSEGRQGLKMQQGQ